MAKRISSLVLLCVTLVSANAMPAGIQLTEEEITTLARGALVKHPMPFSGTDSTIAGTSFILINAPSRVVGRALEDVDAWYAIFPNTTSAKVVAVSGNVKAVKMRLGNHIFKVDFYLMVSHDRESGEFQFELNKTKPHDIEEAVGWARLIPQPEGKTLVVFTAKAKTAFGVLIQLMSEKVIQWIENRILVVPQRLKHWVEGPNGSKYIY